MKLKLKKKKEKTICIKCEHCIKDKDAEKAILPELFYFCKAFPCHFNSVNYITGQGIEPKSISDKYTCCWVLNNKGKCKKFKEKKQ